MVTRIPFQYIAALLSLRDGYARGAEDNGDTISLQAVAMASVLRAYLHGICNFRLQQVEVLVFA